MSSHTEFQLYYYVLNLRYRPHCSKYKDLYYTPQNHPTMQHKKILFISVSMF